MDHQDEGRYGSFQESYSPFTARKEVSEDSNRSSVDSWTCPTNSPLRVTIDRNVVSEKDLDFLAASERAAYKQVSYSGNPRYKEPSCCHPRKVAEFLKRTLPIVSWIPKYPFSKDLLSDVVAGFTVAVMQVPQGMAYAMLANVPPVVGLYTSFFPALIYFFFGTSRHGSIGTFALISMLTNTAMEDVLGDLRDSADFHSIHKEDNFSSVLNVTEIPRTRHFLPPVTPDIQPIDVAVVVSFLVGIIEITMGLARMGSLTVLMSDQMISGLITGTAIQVLTSQLKPLTGAKIEKVSGAFSTVLTWVSFFRNITTINWKVLLVTICSLAFLVFVKYIVDPPVLKKLKIPFPSELILVIVATVLSHQFVFQDKYDIAIIGSIPTGLVSPKMPHLQLVPKLLTGGAMVSIVGVSLSLSIVMSYAKKHSYSVDSNQELIAYGLANGISSFFSCIPCSISLSRSAVLDSSGSRSQMAMLVSCAFLLFVILLLGPLFSALPDAVLSSIIVVALRSMLAGVKDFVATWKTSKSEALVWMLTFLGAIILDIDYGLAIGIVASLVTVLFHAHRPSSTTCLGRLEGTEIYVDVQRFPGVAREIPGVKILRLPGPLYFGNRETLRSQMEALVGLSCNSLSGIASDLEASLDAKPAETQLLLFRFGGAEPVHRIVLDCSAVSFVDSGGVGALVQLHFDLKERGVKLMLVALQDGVMRMIERCGIPVGLTKSLMFPTIHDAVLIADKESRALLGTLEDTCL